MEIHKPHAAKTWKEFFIELGTIVLGILIALSLEQAVENWREHRQYAEARQAMRDELDYNVSNISIHYTQFEPCMRRRLDEIGALLYRAENHQPLVMPRWIGYAPGVRIRFTAESEAGRSGLFTTAEQATFGRLYGFLHSIDADQEREKLAWGRLQMLEGRSALPPDMIEDLRIALADARHENEQIGLTRELLGAMAGLAGVRHDVDIAKAAGAVFQPQAWAPCLPMDTPPDVAMRRANLIQN